MIEIFKDIEGYEGRYKVSNLGNVYSTPKDGKPNRLLKQEVLTLGYKRVSLSKDGKVKRFVVHRLVAQTFIPNLENKPVVNHIDNTPSNNRVDNLEWCTQQENIAHADIQNRRETTFTVGVRKRVQTKIAHRIEEGKKLYGELFIGVDPGRPGSKYIFKCEQCNSIVNRRINFYPGHKLCSSCSHKKENRKIK